MTTFKLIDVNANLTHIEYSGCYGAYSTRIHKPDLPQVLERSWEAGLQKIIICPKDLNESRKGLKIAESDKRLFCTIGCAPENCLQFEENEDTDLYVQQIKDLIALGKEKVVAIGECCFADRTDNPFNLQLKWFKIQLQLSKSFNLPLIISSNGNYAHQFLLRTLRPFPNLKGVIYCLDPTVDIIKRFVDAGFYIGLDIWSFLSEETIEAIKIIPLDKIIFQTNCPRRSILRFSPAYPHISRQNLHELLITKKENWSPGFMVTDRNEPCNIRQILDMAAFVTKTNKSDLAEQVYQNTMRLFFPKENVA
ncbi:deoxyribonuclease TATDN1-like [Diabrotica undecimpunctata]|uniref:deoxyribonuclease TATDN1-like n=1 Tax=Diabrotica undecimpunctata TaxID=50387 RepID=UPI003B64169C